MDPQKAAHEVGEKTAYFVRGSFARGSLVDGSFGPWLFDWNLVFVVWRLSEEIKVSLDSILATSERKITSQNGEDGVIEALFGVIGVTNRYFVEFGVQDATECNSANLLWKGWTGL